MKKVALLLVWFIFLFDNYGQAQTPAYLNTSLSTQARVNDLVSRLTLEEKVNQMLNSTPAIPRLGIPPYDWWNECLHGGLNLKIYGS